MTTLPDALASALPSRERRSPGLELEDGRWMVAAKSGLYVFGAEASSTDGKPTPEVFPWYDVARARRSRSRLIDETGALPRGALPSHAYSDDNGTHPHRMGPASVFRRTPRISG